jgi:hypothetical protein
MLERNLAKRPDNCADIVRTIDNIMTMMPRSSLKNLMTAMFAAELEENADLRPAAMLIGDRGAPRGLVEGTMADTSEEEEAATAVLSPGVRMMMMAELARRDLEGNSPEQEAATVRVSGDELAVLRASLPHRSTPAGPSTMALLTIPDVGRPSLPPAPMIDDQRTAVLIPNLVTQPAIVRTTPPAAVDVSVVVDTPHVVSGVAIAATIIGMVALLLGLLLSSVARTPTPRPLVTAKTAAGPAIGTLVTDFTGAVQLNEADPRLADGTRVTVEELKQRLVATGLSVRRTLPVNLKGWVALALPPVLLGMGQATLGLGAPLLVRRFRGRSLLQASLVLVGIGLMVKWLWLGGLSWPGWAALQTPQTIFWGG